MTAVELVSPATSTWLEHWSKRRRPFLDECREARTALLADLDDPAAAQERVLRDVIDISAGSLLWRERAYDTVAAAPGTFRDVLPIMRYDDFAEAIERETRTKGGILTCSPVLRWLKTSGTTGTSKRVPYTLHWLLGYRIPAMRAMWGTYAECHPEMLAHPYATLDTQTVREDVYDFVHGVEHQAVSNRHPRISGGDWNPPWYEAPWFGPEAPAAHQDRMYHRIRHLVGRQLHYVSAINPSTLISLRDHVAANTERLVRDLRTGALDGVPWGRPDPRAADRLEAVLRDPGFSLKDVWPSLTLYSCWLSASAGLYRGKLDALFPGVDRIPFMSCGTEGVTTIPVDGSLDSQPLAVNQAYFEFVPAGVPLRELLDRGARVPTLLFDEVEAGQEYHLVMSQANGLFRLSTGDIYRVDRIVGRVPWMHFVRRDGVFHSFTGEKVTEAQLTQAIRTGCRDVGLESGLYLCGPRWGEPPSYTVLVETPADGPERTCAVAARVDEALQEINVEYASKRSSGRLNPVEVVLVPPDAISSYVEGRRHSGNAAQYKYQPFQQDTDFVADVLGNPPGGITC